MSYTIPSGSILNFNNNINLLSNNTIININFTYYNSNSGITQSAKDIHFNGNLMLYQNLPSGNSWAYNDGTWAEEYYTITLTSDFVTDDETVIEWFKTNVSSGLPAQPMEEAYQATGNLIASTFTSIGQVTNFISNNAAVGICTVGILIISFVVGLLHRFRKRTFKIR